MLTVTSHAATMILRLRDAAGLKETAGLRIALRDDLVSLHMRLAETPSNDDIIISTDYINVFLGPIAAGRLGSQTLDGRSTKQGSAFYLRQQ